MSNAIALAQIKESANLIEKIKISVQTVKNYTAISKSRFYTVKMYHNINYN